MVSMPHADQLFKFLPPEAALEVLSSSRLRWSAPERFEDPLEAGPDLPLPFEIPSILNATVKMVLSMIFAPDSPKGNAPLIHAIRRWRDESRFTSPDEAMPVIRDLLEKTVNQHIEKAEDTLQRWREHVAKTRMCTFCAHTDNPRLWQNFAAKHSGVALRFDAQQAPFSSAHPVRYQNRRPQLIDTRELLGAIIHNQPSAMESRFEEMHMIKSDAFKTEQEWRCIRAEPSPGDSQYADYEFPAKALTAVYFGLRCDRDFVKKVSALAKQQYPHIKLLSCSLNEGTYELAFAKLTD